MTTPANYTDVAKEILAILTKLETKINKIAFQVEAIYRDDEIVSNDNNDSDEQLTASEQIRKYGQQVSYNLISDPVDVARFREFLVDARRKGSTLKQIERDMIDIADKNFEDIRLSTKHLLILKGVYSKLYNRTFPFKYKQGYMYKLENYTPEWEWFE